jgi:hypothetical protein
MVRIPEFMAEIDCDVFFMVAESSSPVSRSENVFALMFLSSHVPVAPLVGF